MWSNKDLRSYLRKRINTISALLRPVNSLSYTDIHKLRVEIKKVKALFKLIKYFNRTFKGGTPWKSLKTIFREAGKIRELQLEERLLDKYAGRHKLKNRRAHLKISLQKKKKGFLKLINASTRKNLTDIQEKAQPFFFTIHKNDIHTYLKKGKKKIKKTSMGKKLRASEIHKVRKRLKGIYLNQKITGTDKILRSSAKKFLDLLGYWHDLSVLGKHLDKDIQVCSKNPQERQNLKLLHKKIAHDHRSLRKIIESKIAHELA